jgi:hypothetical protein
MESDLVIVCNPSYGNGPYLRTTEIALEVIKALPTPAKIVVPLLYGETQIRIMQEEFGNRDEIILDETYGEILKPLFYDGTSFASFLQHWIETTDQVSSDVQTHLQNTYGDIAMEIARAPLMSTGVTPAYCTLFANLSDIWERSIGIPEINIDDAMLQEATAKMKALEESYALRLICEPGTFSEQESTEASIPLTASVSAVEKVPEQGIYVSVSGIEKLSVKLNTDKTIYSNTPERITRSTKASPNCIGSANILAQFSRAGWGAIWKSLLTSTPLFVMPYDENDDPEIYFNNQKVVALGIGRIYHNEPLDALQEEMVTMKKSMDSYRESLEKRFGTLQGAQVAAKKITEHWLNTTQ